MSALFFIAGCLVLTASCGSPEHKVETQATPVCISDTVRRAASVYVTQDEKNNPVLSWCETDNAGKKFFFLSFFDTLSGKFSAAISIPIEQHASFHEEGMPKVAVKGDGSIITVYETARPTKENEWAGSVHYIQSFDKGDTWTQPKAVHAGTSAGGSRSFASITRLGNGEIGVCWLDASLDTKKGGRPVKFASTKGASGFQSEVMIEPAACECCRTAISCDAKGNISTVFRAIINDSIRDISLSTSSDYGKTFSRAVSFSNDNWVINGCPHNGPSVTNAGTTTYATWFTGGKNRGVFYGVLNQENKPVIKRQVSPNGRNIQLCLLPYGARVIAYSEQLRDADSFYSRITVHKVEGDTVFSLNVTSEKAHASYPVISAYGKDKVVVAWSEDGKIFYKLVEAYQIADRVSQPSDPADYTGADNGGIKHSNHTDPACGMPAGNDVQDTAMVNYKVTGFSSSISKEVSGYSSRQRFYR